MAISASEFVDSWISDNVHPTSYEPEGDHSEAKELAVVCLAEAEAAGISRAAIEAECGELTDYIADAIERTVDEEVKRLVDKDKY